MAIRYCGTRTWLPVAVLLCCANVGWGQVVFTTNTYLGASDPNYTGADIVVDGCTLTVDGAHTFASVQVGAGGRITHSTGVAGMHLTVLQDLTVAAGGYVEAHAKGHSKGVGPGAGGYPNGSGGGMGGGGGGHGGQGGQASGLGGVTYGSVLMPVALGSGGDLNRGGAGGGAIQLTVGGTLTVDGSIWVRGGDGQYDYYYPGGGGSGGSIWVSAGTLAGGGTIDANGGSAVYSLNSAGGGAGGRIALHYDSSTFSGTVTAAGGAGSQRGGAGTIYTKATSQAYGELLLDNGGQAGATTPLLAGSYTFDRVTVRQQAQLEVPSGVTLAVPTDSFSVTDAGRVNVNGGLSSASAALAGGGVLAVYAGGQFDAASLDVQDGGIFLLNTDGTCGTVWVRTGGLIRTHVGVAGMHLTVTGDMEVAAGGVVGLSGAGHAAGAGPGGGSGGAGGGYGGLGGQSGGGFVYGSVAAPADLGSGGSANGTIHEGRGGGVVRLTVGGTLTVDGNIQARGSDASGGGGSGGSLWATAGTLAGVGLIDTRGGNAVGGGGGGGGRIALYYGSSTFSGTVTAAGGAGSQYGGAGTIYTMTPSQVYGDLVMDNGGQVGAMSPLLAGSYTFDSVTVRQQAQLEVPSGVTLAVPTDGLAVTDAGRANVSGGLSSPSVVLAGGGVLAVYAGGQFDAASLDVQDGGIFLLDTNGTCGTVWVRTGGLIRTHVAVAGMHMMVAGDMVVEAGGVVRAWGHRSGEGPGAGSAYQGGGYGGMGGIGAPGNPTGGMVYGSVVAPVDLGSGGDTNGTVTGGRGGGAIRLTVGGRLTVDGDVLARGDDGPSDHGGGSGGSIWIGAETLAGTGVIDAGGGSGAGRGGGGGGRIALYYSASTFSGAVSAPGGSGAQYGGAGTIYRQTPASPLGVLEVDGGSLVSAKTPLPAGAYTLDDIDVHDLAELVIPATAAVTLTTPVVVVGNTGHLTVEGVLTGGGGAGFAQVHATNAGLLHVTSTGVVDFMAGDDAVRGVSAELDGEVRVERGAVFPCNSVQLGDGTFASYGPLVLNDLYIGAGGLLRRPPTDGAGSNFDPNHATFDVTVLGDAYIDGGGRLSADAAGYAPRQGPGAPPQTDGLDGGGGGHGGGGGQSCYNSRPGGPTYGDALLPILAGSGGGGTTGSTFPGQGGGALRLTVTDTLHLDGVVAAEGGDGAGNNGGGGGSGGSVYVTVGTIVGRGWISAGGGDGRVNGSYRGGGGGGGRVAVYTLCEPLFARDHAIAPGGSGCQAGAVGSVHWGIVPDVPPGTCGTRYYVDPAATGGTQDGSAWGNAFLTLDAALAAASQVASDCAEVWVAADTYRPALLTDPLAPRSATFPLDHGVQVYGGFEGLLSTTYPGGETLRAQRDPTLNVTVLSGDLLANDVPGDANSRSDNAWHVVTTRGWETCAVLDGFTITAGNAAGSAEEHGAGLLAQPSRVRLAQCHVVDNEAPQGAGLGGCCATFFIDDVTLSSNAATAGAANWVDGVKFILEGDLTLVDGGFTVQSAMFEGAGALHLGDAAELIVSGATLDARETILATALRGTGTVTVAPTQTLLVDATGHVDLSGGDGSACADPQTAPAWGQVAVDGRLRVHGGTVQSTQITVAESGRFDAEAAALVRCNTITATGDRFLDLDPDPAADTRPTVTDNLIRVQLPPADTSQGALLELRSVDHDHALGNGRSGAYQLPASPGYGGDWTLDELTLAAGARLNLTNRQGFVFQDPNLPTPEALYVRTLRLGLDAVLNTGLQRVYYQTLVDESGAPLTVDPNDPSAPLANGSRISDVPLLSYSLKIIELDDPEEFMVRVQGRTQDPNDVVPTQPPLPLGQVAQVPDPLDLNNGCLRLATAADGYTAALSVAAHGAFGRAGEDRILVAFNYRWAPEAVPGALVVYLSDTPELRRPGDDDQAAHFIEVARLYPPPSGPGAIGSNRWARFHAEFPRGLLNFTRGTYVELELRGAGAALYVDRWDPQITCSTQCFDLDGHGDVTRLDYLLLLSEMARRVVDPLPLCVDSKLTGDYYVDVADLFGMDLLLAQTTPPANACEPPSAPPDLGDQVAVPTTGLLIAGKAGGLGVQHDRLYTFDADAQPIESLPLMPASWSAPGQEQRGNGRLVRRSDGQLFQVHASQGVLALATALRTLPPGSYALGAKTVFVGPVPTGDYYPYPIGYANGLPLVDATFSRRDPNSLYVAPVVVLEGGNYYRAAAKFHVGAGGPQLRQVYGRSPWTDPCTGGTEPPYASNCWPQGQRAVEVDGLGNVFVLSSYQYNDNDYLLVYDEATGAERLRVTLRGLQPDLADPTCLVVSQRYCNRLFIAGGLSGGSGLETRVYAFQIQRGGNAVTGIASLNSVRVHQPTPPVQYGVGYASHITDLYEHPLNGRLYALGFSMARVPDALSSNSSLYEALFCDTCPLPTQPTLAIIANADAPDAEAELLTGYDLALPLGLAAVDPPVPAACKGDTNCDGAITFLDIDPFVSRLGCPTGGTCTGTCPWLNADVNGDGAVTFADIDPFVARLGCSCQ